jgi:hypothetical protein
MKNIFLFFLCCIFWMLHSLAQAQSIEIAAGQNFIPGDYLSLRYESSPDYTLNWAIKAFAERSHPRSLKYCAYGLDLLAVYPLRILRLAAGPTIHFESEPWVYAGWDFSKRLNFGVTAETALQFDISENISLTATAQQKFLLNSALGNTHFICAVGIKYSFGN